MNLFGREPVLWMAAVRALVVLGTAFGLDLTPEQMAAVYGATEALLALYTRSKVLPR